VRPVCVPPRAATGTIRFGRWLFLSAAQTGAVPRGEGLRVFDDGSRTGAHRNILQRGAGSSRAGKGCFLRIIYDSFLFV